MENRIVDRSGWAAGPWDGEPDRLEWRDEATGLPCLIVRNPMGGLCGYAGVPPSHPWHGKGYSTCVQQPDCGESYCAHSPEAAIEVHGGLTYADKCHGSICHVPAPGESDDVWWFGFDCVHHMDLVPKYTGHVEAFMRPGPEDSYRDVAYVRGHVTKLAGQLAAVSP